MWTTYNLAAPVAERISCALLTHRRRFDSYRGHWPYKRKVTNMFYIEAVQFHRPYGEQTIELIPISKDILRDKYYKFIKNLDLRFTLEVLPTRDISVCLEHPYYGDFDIEIIDKKSIASYIEKMIDKFDEDKYDNWLRIMVENS